MLEPTTGHIRSSRTDNLCLAVTEEVLGALAIMKPCQDHDSLQEWALLADTTASVLVHVSTKMCLEVSHVEGRDMGITVQVNKCEGDSHQVRGIGGKGREGRRRA